MSVMQKMKKYEIEQEYEFIWMEVVKFKNNWLDWIICFISSFLLSISMVGKQIFENASNECYNKCIKIWTSKT